MDSNQNTPAKTDSRQPLLGMTLQQLRQLCADEGLKPFAARQIARWLYEKRATDIRQMTDLSLQARDKLSKRYCVGYEEPITSAKSQDGTVKYLFPGAGGHAVEAVYIPDGERATLCISSQAGCKMGCTFCMTGRQGFHGNLTAAQIMNQILTVDRRTPLSNIVFMGMGEPTDNLQPVLEVIEVLTAKWGLAWSPKRITVSSVGRLRELRQLIENTHVHIALSVHSPFAAERARLMPVEKAWPVDRVLRMVSEFDFAHQRRFSVEYIMWRGLNDDMTHADALVKLLKGTDARVNLIRFHVIPDSTLEPSSQRHMEAFRDRLNAAGITATIRASRGEDIMAACGMLAGSKTEH